jgi:phosphatidylglycerophosphate synthase
LNGIIDDFDGKVARALDQCSTMGYLVDCAADNLAVVTNTACIAHAAMTSAAIPREAQWAICLGMQFYAMFFISWSALATAIPNYKGNHATALARWYYGTTIGDFALYLGMQTFWCALYLFVEGTHAKIGLNILKVAVVPFFLKFFVECENVYFLTLEVMKKDIKAFG